MLRDGGVGKSVHDLGCCGGLKLELLSDDFGDGSKPPCALATPHTVSVCPSRTCTVAHRPALVPGAQGRQVRSTLTANPANPANPVVTSRNPVRSSAALLLEPKWLRKGQSMMLGVHEYMMMLEYMMLLEYMMTLEYTSLSI